MISGYSSRRLPSADGYTNLSGGCTRILGGCTSFCDGYTNPVAGRGRGRPNPVIAGVALVLALV
ncbi:MAG TPA: hypothetical protein DCS31_10895, partial [Candidatus Competibacteraceae bacterium]|nr:hypothetical protein [Candidatus Competibacteraceae bacterium]